MIQSLGIERFKSIKKLSLQCRKVNVFIGPPDTGKTNILESLFFLSRMGWGQPIDNSLRLRPEMGFDPLFYRQFFDQPIEWTLRLKSQRQIHQEDITIRASISGGVDRRLEITSPFGGASLNFGSTASQAQLEWIRYYSYLSSERWSYQTGYLNGTTIVTPPYGDNLLYIARHNMRVYDYLKNIVAGLNWKLKFDQAQRTFRLSEVRRDDIVEYNLDLLSDSLKRQFFYGAILHSSENGTLVLDEPDVFAFPPFPKALGEMIGGDTTNQFFLTTHNPYFLTGLVEKTPRDDLAVFICYRDEEGSTKADQLSMEKMPQLVEFGANVFFNLDDLRS